MSISTAFSFTLFMYYLVLLIQNYTDILSPPDYIYQPCFYNHYHKKMNTFRTGLE